MADKAPHLQPISGTKPVERLSAQKKSVTGFPKHLNTNVLLACLATIGGTGTIAAACSLDTQGLCVESCGTAGEAPDGGPGGDGGEAGNNGGQGGVAGEAGQGGSGGQAAMGGIGGIGGLGGFAGQGGVDGGAGQGGVGGDAGAGGEAGAGGDAGGDAGAGGAGPTCDPLAPNSIYVPDQGKCFKQAQYENGGAVVVQAGTTPDSMPCQTTPSCMNNLVNPQTYPYFPVKNENGGGLTFQHQVQINGGFDYVCVSDFVEPVTQAQMYQKFLTGGTAVTDADPNPNSVSLSAPCATPWIAYKVYLQ